MGSAGGNRPFPTAGKDRPPDRLFWIRRFGHPPRAEFVIKALEMKW